MLSIIRRIDTDGDAKLSYEEFSEFLRLTYPSRSLLEETLKSRSYSEEKNRKNLSASTYDSPLRARSTYNSPQRNYSAAGIRNKAVAFQTPERYSASPLR